MPNICGRKLIAVKNLYIYIYMWALLRLYNFIFFYISYEIHLFCRNRFVISNMKHEQKTIQHWIVVAIVIVFMLCCHNTIHDQIHASEIHSHVQDIRQQNFSSFFYSWIWCEFNYEQANIRKLEMLVDGLLKRSTLKLICSFCTTCI